MKVQAFVYFPVAAGGGTIPDPPAEPEQRQLVMLQTGYGGEMRIIEGLE